MSSYYIEYITGPKGVTKLRRGDQWGYSITEIFKITTFISPTLRDFLAKRSLWRRSALSPGAVKIKVFCWQRIGEFDDSTRYVDIINRRLAFKRF